MGVALSDPLKITAQGLTTIRFETDAYKKAMRLLKETLANYEVEVFVLGNPLHMNGEHSLSAQRSLDFKKRLENSFNVPVIMWDERMSSLIVEKAMISMDVSRKKRKEVVDELAAVNILQGYLDSTC